MNTSAETTELAELKHRITSLEAVVDAHGETLGHILEAIDAMHQTQARLIDLLENL